MRMRILVAFEDDYRAYREVIAAGISILRPHVEVETASLEALGERIEHFHPELVICGGHEAAPLGGTAAWVEIPLDPLQPAKLWVGERYSELSNTTVEELAAVIDGVEELTQTNGDIEGS